MKICVLGLDGATPEKIFQDERIVNIRRLMDMGVYGRLKAVAQTGTVPIWMCMGASQDSESPNLHAQTIWSVLSDTQNRTAVLGLTSDFPPHEVNGVSFASFPSSGAASAPVPQTVIPPKPHSLAEQISFSSHARWQTARSVYSGQAWAYFQVVDYSALDDRDDLAFCEWLVKEGGVAAIPISAFYESPPAEQRLIRFCFAKSDATLEQAAERLRAL